MFSRAADGALLDMGIVGEWVAVFIHVPGGLRVAVEADPRIPREGIDGQAEPLLGLAEFHALIPGVR